jgi:hypothetical protein
LFGGHNYCYWRMYFWQLILYPLAVNIWLFVAFHCQRMCLVIVFVCFRKFYFMTSSSILRILLKPQLNFILLNFNFSFFNISRRLPNGNQWNFTGMLSIMSRCADYFRNFQNGRHCRGNGQNTKNWKTQKWS